MLFLEVSHEKITAFLLVVALLFLPNAAFAQENKVGYEVIDSEILTVDGFAFTVDTLVDASGQTFTAVQTPSPLQQRQAGFQSAYDKMADQVLSSPIQRSQASTRAGTFNDTAVDKTNSDPYSGYTHATHWGEFYQQLSGSSYLYCADVTSQVHNNGPKFPAWVKIGQVFSWWSATPAVSLSFPWGVAANIASNSYSEQYDHPEFEDYSLASINITTFSAELDGPLNASLTITTRASARVDGKIYVASVVSSNLWP